jgi:hypothetical protein
MIRRRVNAGGFTPLDEMEKQETTDIEKQLIDRQEEWDKEDVNKAKQQFDIIYDDYEVYPKPSIFEYMCNNNSYAHQKLLYMLSFKRRELKCKIDMYRILECSLLIDSNKINNSISRDVELLKNTVLPYKTQIKKAIRLNNKAIAEKKKPINIFTLPCLQFLNPNPMSIKDKLEKAYINKILIDKKITTINGHIKRRENILTECKGIIEKVADGPEIKDLVNITATFNMKSVNDSLQALTDNLDKLIINVTKFEANKENLDLDINLELSKDITGKDAKTSDEFSMLLMSIFDNEGEEEEEEEEEEGGVKIKEKISVVLNEQVNVGVI